MKSIQLYALAIFVLFSSSPRINAATMDWQADIMPGSILTSLGDAFTLSGPQNAKESMSLLSSFPNLTFGITVEHGNGFIELRGGPGLLLNSRVRALAMIGSLGASYEIKPSVIMGPHIQAMKFSNLDWWGDGAVEFSDAPGFGAGLHLAMGDKISYLFSVDYISMSFDAKPGANWTANDDKLDMSGLAVQFGIRANF